MANKSPFKEWQQTFRDRFGEAPNLDSPDYNTRAAWLSGAQPKPYAPDGGLYHWPSNSGELATVGPWATPVPFKSSDHPSAWMQTYMDANRVDPMSVSPWERYQMMTNEQNNVNAPGGMAATYGPQNLPAAPDTRPSLRPIPFANTQDASAYQGGPMVNTLADLLMGKK
jgi:hypothetical protein